MFKLIFTNSRDESIELFGRPFRLTNVEGLGDVDADTQGQRSPFQDGENYLDSVLEPRYMTIELRIVGKDEADVETLRRRLATVFNPKLHLGTLKYVRGDMVREIKAVAESVPSFPDGTLNRGRWFQRALINVMAPNPYWKSPEVTEEPAFEPLFEWPSDYWEEGEDGDMYFEMGIQRAERIINNDGDAPAPLMVDFYGPAQSPIIENLTTGEFIRINKQLSENEVFKIDTGAKTLIYVDEDGNETNVFHWIDPDSTFFNLEIGENEISCHCVISNLAKDFDIYYSKLFTAV